jgi:hypothetical protein
MFYALKNLSAGDCVALSLGQLMARPARPDSFADKAEFRAWCAAPSSAGTFYSLVEGAVPGLRVTKSNPPARIHGLVADYDASLTDAMLEDCFAACPADLQPVAMSRTFSGGARVIWLFAEPINVFDKDIVGRVIKRLFKLTKAKSILPGLDDGPIENYFTQYYELGTGWMEIKGGCLISTQTVGLQLAEVVGDVKVDTGGTVDIPIEEVATEVNKQWPGKWKGDFAVGARGPRFWDSNASHDTAAIVREGGVAYFTDGGGFVSWTQLLGNDFVRKYRERTRGEVIANVWYDGSDYFAPGPDGHGWVDYTTAPIQRYLMKRGVSDRVAKGEEMSELDRTLSALEETKRVQGLAPFVHRHESVVRTQGNTFLNVATAKCHDMDLDPSPWGERFPFIAGYLTELFLDNDQLHRWLAWMHRFYRCGYDGRPRKGQALFIFGPTSTGKTLLSTRIIGPLVGGAHPATSYLMGAEKFTGETFKSPLLTVDDGLASCDEHSRNRYANELKKLVANPMIEYREMYRSPTKVEWLGRVCVTGNLDALSLRMLPSRELSNADKQLILRAKARATPFPEDVEEIIERELSAFARFVYDYEPIPDHVGDPRYGTKAFCDPLLELEIADTSVSAGMGELLQMWRKQYFVTHESETEWEGTATEMLESLSEMSEGGKSKLLEGVNRVTLGRALSRLTSEDRNGWIVAKRSAKGRVYVVTKGE